MQGKRLTDAASFLIFLTGILLFLALATHRPEAPANMVGRAGNHAAGLLMLLLGRASFLIPLYLVYLGGQALYRGALVDGLVRLSSMIVAVCTAAIWVGLVSQVQSTGWVGETIGGMLEFAFGKWGGFILSFGLFLPAAFLATGLNMSETLRKASELITRLDNAEPKPADEASMSYSKEVKRTAMLAGLGVAASWVLDRLKDRQETSPGEPGPALVQTRMEDNLPFFQKLPGQTSGAISEPAAPAPAASNALPPSAEPDHRIFGGVRVSNAHARAAEIRRIAEPPLFPGQFNLDQSRFVFKKIRSEKSPSSFEPVFQGQTSPASAFTAVIERPESRSPDVSAVVRADAGVESVMESGTATSTRPGEGAFLEREAQSPEAAEPQAMEDLQDEDSASVPGPDAPSALVSPVSEGRASFRSPEINDERENEEEDLDDAPSGVWIATHVPPVRRRGGRYNLPTDILALSPVVPEQDVGREIELTKARLEKTLHDFDVPGKVTNIQRGPIITLFEVLLDPGVRASRILRIETEIRMNLAVPSVRIVAPLPNKTTVGIEVPNAIRQTVTVGEIIRKDRNFFSRENLLGIALGKDISGKNHYMDIARMPHVLIAGASGQGKSVFMNSMIASLLYRYSPEEVRFIMIDPKMVELTLFEGIPHLLTPVITEPALAAKVLDWILMEMETRYTHFKRVRCRDIVSYNERVKADKSGQPIPYIVIVIDELADLMQTSSKEVENALWRLAQKARAVGIHMILATQRPSVDVITPHIKSNAPARIAFKVAQKTDSRIILDESGGEALLGQGDMLYRSPQSTIDRIQSPLITEQEMASIVTETRRYGEPVFIDIAVAEETEDDMDEDGAIDAELLAEAWKIIQETGKTSGSFLQRRLRIGYNRAANVVEALEQKGYLGPAIGTRPREILKRS